MKSNEMRERSESATAIWVVCIGIGLLFLARGAFQPYIFPLFENLAGFSYGQIALLLNCYVFAQSVCAPLAGWFTDRTTIRIALTTSVAMALSGFLLIALRPGYVLSAAAVFAAGFAFVLGKIALNTILVLHSSPELLRNSVAKRATLLNLGSFCGNSLALQMLARAGSTAHAVLLGVLHLPLLIGLTASPSPSSGARPKVFGLATVKSLCKNRAFLADCVRRFATVLPYGCWGTIIPKYIIDQYHSNDPVWIVYLTSLCTTVVGAHLLARNVSPLLYRWGFKWEWWSMVSILLYCGGLMLLIFSTQPIMLPLAIVVFICGEVVMTPCFDETAKKHSAEAGMATCIGLLHLVDGFGRLFGAIFALAVYGLMMGSPYREYYWHVVVATFLPICVLLQFVAYALSHPRIQDAK